MNLEAGLCCRNLYPSVCSLQRLTILFPDSLIILEHNRHFLFNFPIKHSQGKYFLLVIIFICCAYIKYFHINVDQKGGHVGQKGLDIKM